MRCNKMTITSRRGRKINVLAAGPPRPAYTPILFTASCLFSNEHVIEQVRGKNPRPIVPKAIERERNRYSPFPFRFTRSQKKLGRPWVGRLFNTEKSHRPSGNARTKSLDYTTVGRMTSKLRFGSI